MVEAMVRKGKKKFRLVDLREVGEENGGETFPAASLSPEDKRNSIGKKSDGPPEWGEFDYSDDSDDSLCRKIHGCNNSSDSSDGGLSEFDERHERMKPDPVEIDPNIHHIIVVKAEIDAAVPSYSEVLTSKNGVVNVDDNICTENQQELNQSLDASDQSKTDALKHAASNTKKKKKKKKKKKNKNKSNDVNTEFEQLFHVSAQENVENLFDTQQQVIITKEEHDDGTNSSTQKSPHGSEDNLKQRERIGISSGSEYSSADVETICSDVQSCSEFNDGTEIELDDVIQEGISKEEEVNQVGDEQKDSVAATLSLLETYCRSNDIFATENVVALLRIVHGMGIEKSLCLIAKYLGCEDEASELRFVSLVSPSVVVDAKDEDRGESEGIFQILDRFNRETPRSFRKSLQEHSSESNEECFLDLARRKILKLLDDVRRDHGFCILIIVAVIMRWFLPDLVDMIAAFFSSVNMFAIELIIFVLLFIFLCCELVIHF